MKKAIFIGIFVFSLLLNLTVASILGWHYLVERRNVRPPVAECPMLDEGDFREISRVWSRNARSGMAENRRLVREKQSELIDQIAKTPGDLTQAENKIKELMDLREKMEREALSRLSSALVQLPPEKREALLVYVKNRSCMSPGMRFGGHMGKGRPRFQDEAQQKNPAVQ